MIYLKRILWLIGYIPVFIAEGIFMIISLMLLPFVVFFYFVKDGTWETCNFNPGCISEWIEEKYKSLLD